MGVQILNTKAILLTAALLWPASQGERWLVSASESESEMYTLATEWKRQNHWWVDVCLVSK